MTKRVLVTGGAGFVGHHVIKTILSQTDWHVVSLDRLDTSGNLNRLADVLNKSAEYASRLSIVFHDLKAPINEMVCDMIGKVDYILHLAAGSHVDRSIEYPMEFVLDNVVGTGNILEFARLYTPDTLEKFLCFSTDEVFGPAPENIFYKEDDRYRSGNPYSATKAGAEELCIAYENTYNLPIMVTHTMNVFGIRQHWEKFIPLIIRKVLNGEEITIHADSTCTQAGSRHYISTEDVSDAVLFLLEKGKSGEKYNVVGKEETDNLELAKMIAEIIDKPLIYQMVDFHTSRPGHDLRYALDGGKMREMGWEPAKSLKERLAEVIDWSLNNRYWIGG